MSTKQDVAQRTLAGKAVENLATQVQRIDSDAESTRRKFYRALVKAHDFGFTYEELALMSAPLGEQGEGLSRIRIGQILKEERARQEAGE